MAGTMLAEFSPESPDGGMARLFFHYRTSDSRFTSDTRHVYCAPLQVSSLYGTAFLLWIVAATVARFVQSVTAARHVTAAAGVKRT